jgi:hypothetical protein
MYSASRPFLGLLGSSRAHSRSSTRSRLSAKNMISSGTGTLGPSFLALPVLSHPPWRRSGFEGAVADPHRDTTGSDRGRPRRTWRAEPSAALARLHSKPVDTVG